MNLDLVNQIANAVLYEGYILYPYRRSAVKNQQRWNFGVLYPRAYAEAQTGHDTWSMQTECLGLLDPEATIDVRIRFLQLVSRIIGRLDVPVSELPAAGELAYTRVDSLEVGSQTFQSWEEAIEREVTVPGRTIAELQHGCTIPFSIPAGKTVEPIHDGAHIAGVIVREHETLNGEVSLLAQREGTACKLRVVLTNRDETGRPDDSRQRVLMTSLLSAHAIFTVQHGEFISLLDPPAEFRSAAAACNNVGCWPVLVGQADQRDTMLASPIILYDYPQVAPQSPGDLFDGAEIDEILSLRIMTLTDEEKREMRTADERARMILDRTEALPAEQFMKLHGVMRR